MTWGSLDTNPQTDTWLPAPIAGDSLASPRSDTRENLPAGPRLGVWLLWLCFGLPASVVVFVGLPGLLAFFAVEILEQSDVPLEVWTEFEPWVALVVLAGLVNHRASFTHRRQIEANTKSGAGRVWMLVGGLAGLGWLGLLGIERFPESVLNPQLHYWALSAVLVWTGLSLAWVSGRVVSVILAPLERRAIQSGPLRGSLSTAGPLSVVALIAVGGVTFGLDEDDEIAEARALVASTFEDDWSLIETKGRGGGSSSGSSTPTTPSRPMIDDDCIEEIYEGGPSSLFQRAVRSISSYSYVDAESVAADVAIDVCLDDRRPTQLRSYYLRSVRNRANSHYTRHRRFGECSLGIEDPYRIPTGETSQDCLRQQLCRMDVDDQEVLVHLFKGGTARELAGMRMIGEEAAKKQRSRAKKRLETAFRRECMD